MPFQEHPTFQAPIDRDQPIWRYIDLEKYVATLETGALFFSRADTLGDEFEGTYTVRDLEHFANMTGGKPFNIAPQVGINCWHQNTHENHLMWQAYTRSGSGAVAIRSTYRRLAEALHVTRDSVMIGVVRYFDYEREGFSQGPDIPQGWNAYLNFLSKRSLFDGERELRAVYGSAMQLPAGRSISVDISQLIEAVHIAPRTPAWIADMLRSVSSKYGLSAPIVQSQLDSGPSW